MVLVAPSGVLVGFWWVLGGVLSGSSRPRDGVLTGSPTGPAACRVGGSAYILMPQSCRTLRVHIHARIHHFPFLLFLFHSNSPLLPVSPDPALPRPAPPHLTLAAHQSASSLLVHILSANPIEKRLIPT